MFPRPIEHQSRAVRVGYQLALPVALILWLLPLIGVAITSVKPASDLAAGNYFGMPSYLAFSNYADVFTGSPIGQYIFNSFKVTIPTVIGTLILSCLTGFALGVYKFKANIFIFFMFVAGINFSLHLFAWRYVSIKHYFQDQEFRAYSFILLALSGLVIGSLFTYRGFADPFDTFLDGLFQSVSIATTTGFTTENFAIWPAALPALLIFSSFVGGSAGNGSNVPAGSRPQT